MAKVHLIVDYIKNLEIGRKISVRSIATELNISEGTAYKAIKECEGLGYIKTLPRAGTIRVESPKEKSVKNLNYEEILKIVEGTLLSGESGIEKLVYKFIIGAMEIDAMKKYVSPGGLVIVGNREEAQILALSNSNGVIISGGFGISEKVMNLSDKLSIPVISSPFDTFTIASLINRALSQNLIKQRILYVGDIMNQEVISLSVEDSIERWRELSKTTGFGSFPLVDEKGKLVGVLNNKDLLNVKSDEDRIEKYSKKPLEVNPKTTVAYASHIMEWEDRDFLPVTDGNALVGIVTKGNVFKSIKERWNLHKGTENMEDRLVSGLEYSEENGKYYFRGRVTSEMLDPLGTFSRSLTAMMISKTASIVIKNNELYLETDNLSVSYMEPLQLDNNFILELETVSLSRMNAKIFVKVYTDDGRISAIGTVSAMR